MVAARVSRYSYQARRTATEASVSLARVRAALAADRERQIQERLAAIPALDLEHRLHAELLAEMASVTDGGWRDE